MTTNCRIRSGTDRATSAPFPAGTDGAANAQVGINPAIFLENMRLRNTDVDPEHMENRKILVIAEYGWRNGGENSLLAVVAGLQHRGWKFVFACPGDSELSDYVRRINIDHVNWSVIGKNGSRMSQVEIRRQLAGLIAQQQPAIVHCNSLSTGRLAGPVAAALKIPSLGYLRDIIKLSRQAIADLDQLERIVAVSHATREFHVAQGLNPDHVQVIYNGVDLKQFSPRDGAGILKSELGIPEAARLILCIGQISLRKGTDTVIKAFLDLAKRFENLHLVLIGMRNSQKQESVEYENSCRRLGDDSLFAGQIHWLGRRTDVDRIFNEARLLLHGARQEPLGRVLLEASASGCPFVATNVGGTSEIVGDCHPDLTMCKVDSVEDMNRTAARLLADQ